MTTAARKFIRLYPDVFRLNNDGLLFCLKCGTIVNSKRKFLIVQHLKTIKHRNSNVKPHQDSLLHDPFQHKAEAVFEKRLHDAFVEANLPIFKLQLPVFQRLFRDFNLPYNGQTSDVIEHLLYENMNKIRPQIACKDVFIKILEFSFNAMDFLIFFIGSLSRPEENHIFEVIHLTEGMSPEKTIVRIINNSIFKMQINSENILLLLTKPNENMINTGKYLKILYSKLNHVTCVSEIIRNCHLRLRENYTDLDSLMGSTGSLVQWLESIERYSELKCIPFNETQMKEIEAIKSNYLQFKILTKILTGDKLRIIEAGTIFERIDFYDDPVNMKTFLESQTTENNDLKKIKNQENFEITSGQYEQLYDCRATLNNFDGKIQGIRNTLNSLEQTISSDDIRTYLLQVFMQRETVPDTPLHVGPTASGVQIKQEF